MATTITSTRPKGSEPSRCPPRDFAVRQLWRSVSILPPHSKSQNRPILVALLLFHSGVLRPVSAIVRKMLGDVNPPLV